MFICGNAFGLCVADLLVIGPSKTLNVPADYTTIQAAIDNAASGDTIDVAAGVYNETLFITQSDLTFQGAGSGASIIDGEGNTIITIDGASKIAISGFTIQNGGRAGIYLKSGAFLELFNSIVQDCSYNGIRIVENSTARINDTSILRSGDDGICIFINSCATFSGSIVLNDNISDGLQVMSSSSAIIYDATVNSTDNGRSGFRIGLGSSLVLSSSNTVCENNHNGIFIDGVANMSLSGGTINTINNEEWGIQVNTSSLSISSCNVTSSGNGYDGLGIFDGGHIGMTSGGIVANNNGGHGINLYTNASIIALGSGGLAIENNFSFGLILSDGSSARLENGLATIQNNATDLGVFSGSRAFLNNGNTIGDISCDNDGSGRIYGDEVCP